MKLRETMICWHPAEWSARPVPDPIVKCGPHPSKGWDRPYQCSDGACYFRLDGRADRKGWREVSADERLLRLFVLFAIMTTRDGVPAAEVHNAFLAIDEYREAMPPDARQLQRKPVEAAA